jgi:hypothetical protein
MGAVHLMFSKTQSEGRKGSKRATILVGRNSSGAGLQGFDLEILNRS